MAMNSSSPISSASNTGMMLGWSSEATARLSSTKRCLATWFRNSRCPITLSATCFPRRVCSARYTAPMAPSSILASIRYRPSVVPTMRSVSSGGGAGEICASPIPMRSFPPRTTAPSMRWPFTNVPLREPRSRSTMRPLSSTSSWAWRLDTRLSSRTTSQEGSRPSTTCRPSSSASVRPPADVTVSFMQSPARRFYRSPGRPIRARARRRGRTGGSPAASICRMAKDSFSFDIVSEVDMAEVSNALDQARRELATRFDFKNTGTSIERDEDLLEIRSSTEDRLKAALEVLKEKMVRREIPLKALSTGPVQPAAGGTYRMNVHVNKGITDEKARELTKFVKGLSVKVQSQVQGDQVRITGKKKDDLQAVIRAVREHDFGIALQFTNFRP